MVRLRRSERDTRANAWMSRLKKEAVGVTLSNNINNDNIRNNNDNINNLKNANLKIINLMTL